MDADPQVDPEKALYNDAQRPGPLSSTTGSRAPLHGDAGGASGATGGHTPRGPPPGAAANPPALQRRTHSSTPKAQPRPRSSSCTAHLGRTTPRDGPAMPFKLGSPRRGFLFQELGPRAQRPASARGAGHGTPKRAVVRSPSAPVVDEGTQTMAMGDMGLKASAESPELDIPDPALHHCVIDAGQARRPRPKADPMVSNPLSNSFSQPI